VDFFKLITWRRSVRKFAPRTIEREKLIQILDAARIAPSSSNRQAWHFVVVDDRRLIEQIPKQVAMGEKMAAAFLKDAPCVIAGCYTKALTHHLARVFKHENYLVDVSIAMHQICLAAAALGIGSCYVGWFHTRKLKKLLGIPPHYSIAVLLGLGYPAEPSTEEAIGGVPARRRKAFDDIVSHNTYGNKL
jgi:nitroreductase